MILEMAADGLADRVALGSRDDGVTFAELGRRSRRAATVLAGMPCTHVVLVDENSPAVPIGLFGSAIASTPFVPVNYRLADDRLRAIISQVTPALVVAGRGVPERLAGLEGIQLIERADFLAMVEDEAVEETDGWDCDPEAVAVLLFTSGTTGDPKAAVLRHRNLASYVVGSVEFGAAAEDECAIVSVPPYHIAAISSVLTDHLLRSPSGPTRGVRPGPLGGDRAGRVGDPRDGRPDDARSDPGRRRGRRVGAAESAVAVLRRGPDARTGGRAGAADAPRRRPRQRLRLDRDLEHDRAARPRTPPRARSRATTRRSGPASDRSARRSRESSSRSATPPAHR